MYPLPGSSQPSGAGSGLSLLLPFSPEELLPTSHWSCRENRLPQGSLPLILHGFTSPGLLVPASDLGPAFRPVGGSPNRKGLRWQDSGPPQPAGPPGLSAPPGSAWALTPHTSTPTQVSAERIAAAPEPEPWACSACTDLILVSRPPKLSMAPHCLNRRPRIPAWHPGSL